MCVNSSLSYLKSGKSLSEVLKDENKSPLDIKPLKTIKSDVN